MIDFQAISDLGMKFIDNCQEGWVGQQLSVRRRLFFRIKMINRVGTFKGGDY